MADVIECSFMIPIRRDANLSDGQVHESATWEKLYSELFVRFGGRTIAPGLYAGAYKDPDTGQEVGDESRRFIVAVPETALDDLRQLLVECCDRFQQKCIYLSVAGRVEFIAKP